MFSHALVASGKHGLVKSFTCSGKKAPLAGRGGSMAVQGRLLEDAFAGGRESVLVDALGLGHGGQEEGC